MTHTTGSDHGALTDEDWAADLFVTRLYEAAEQTVEDIYACRPEAVRVFKRLWKLMGQEAAEHPRLGFRQTSTRAALTLLKTGSPEAAIRRELERDHDVVLTGITDLEIGSYGRRFRARLHDFGLAKANGPRDLASLKAAVAGGAYGAEEAMCVLGAGRYRTPPVSRDRMLASVTPFDRRRVT